jgi:type VI secretion system protein ImpF
MAELTAQERLQPCLLDRLTDDDPENKQEARDRRVIPLKRLKEYVLRDLAWLLNTQNFTATEDLTPYPFVRTSVLNYGVPDLTGRTLSGINLAELERLLRDAIGEFEPRLLRRSLKLRLVNNPDQMNHNALTFEISGELWAQPVPLEIFLKTELDLEIGEVKVFEVSGGGRD